MVKRLTQVVLAGLLAVGLVLGTTGASGEHPAEKVEDNLAGQKVATLGHGSRMAGTHTLHWDGRDDNGRELASAVYLYRLAAGEHVETKKLLLLR